MGLSDVRSMVRPRAMSLRSNLSNSFVIQRGPVIVFRRVPVQRRPRHELSCPHALRLGYRVPNVKLADCRRFSVGVFCNYRTRPHREATACAPPGVSIACGNGGAPMSIAPTLQIYLDQTITYELIQHEPTMSSGLPCLQRSCGQRHCAAAWRWLPARRACRLPPHSSARPADATR